MKPYFPDAVSYQQKQSTQRYSHFVVTVRPVLSSTWDSASLSSNSSGKTLTSPEDRKQDKALGTLFHLDSGYAAPVEIVPHAIQATPRSAHQYSLTFH